MVVHDEGKAEHFKTMTIEFTKTCPCLTSAEDLPKPKVNYHSPPMMTSPKPHARITVDLVCSKCGALWRSAPAHRLIIPKDSLS